MYIILITSVGGTLAPFLIDKIRNGRFKDLKIIGTNQSNKCTAKYFLDNFVVTSGGNSPKYIEQMKKIVKKFKINLLIPGSDEEALNLSKNKKYFQKLNCNLATIDYETLCIFSDKIKTYQALKEKTYHFLSLISLKIIKK